MRQCRPSLTTLSPSISLSFNPSPCNSTVALAGLLAIAGASERTGLQQLYHRALQGSLFWVVPAALLLCVVARPFFTLWAGPEYGRESTLPLYILAAGLVFEVMAFFPIPYSTP